MNKLPVDTQPLDNPDDHRRRRYIPAEWSPVGAGSGHPKLSGGYEVDEHGTPIATRGLNNKDQRYLQSAATLQANRVTRAAIEFGATVILRDSDKGLGIRPPSGNNYDVDYPITKCDCPDYWRLVNSGFITVSCKHMLMANAAIVGTGGFEFIPASCEYVAVKSGFSVRAIQQACEKGVFMATKMFGVWVIDDTPPGTLDTAIELFVSRVVIKDGWASIDDLILSLE